MTESSGAEHWYTDRKFTISITAFLFILPLSVPKEIGFQKYARYLQDEVGKDWADEWLALRWGLFLWPADFIAQRRTLGQSSSKHEAHGRPSCWVCLRLGGRSRSAKLVR